MFDHSLVFDSPGYLLLLLLIPLIWVWGYRSLAGLGRWRRLFALFFRSLVVAIIVFALADVQYQRRTDELTVVYVLDQSLSIPVEKRRAMIDYVRSSIDQHLDAQKSDRYAVIVFGRDAEVEVPLIEVNVVRSVESLFDPEYTDLATAIRRAKAIFPYDAAKRIVLVTDGNQNLGNAYREARAATSAGVSIDVVPVYLQSRGEVSVEKIDVPAGVRKDQPFKLRVVLDNDAEEGSAAAVRGDLRIVRKAGQQEELVAEEEVELQPGKQVFTIPEQIEFPDFYTYEARFIAEDPADDGMVQNNLASAFTHIRGSGQVLMIENFEKQGEFDYLADSLGKMGIEVSLRSTDDLFTSLAELQRYDAIILANVSRSAAEDADNIASFSDAQISMLVQNTRELGCGLVMIGGPD
ncbi:MAG: vWA domain-containing protein, partial [Planctomycetota bacterium]